VASIGVLFEISLGHQSVDKLTLAGVTMDRFEVLALGRALVGIPLIQDVY